jgi:hypothetical protein
MGRIYTVTMQGTVTAAGGDTDWLEVTPADDKPVKLRGMLISQISEVGDSAEEGLRFTVVRLPATFTSGSGGSAPTPVAMDSADAAAGFAAEVNNTTVATTSGTALNVVELGWNERNSPYEMWFPDERFAPKAKQGEGLVVRQQTTLADDMTACATFWVEEE